MHRAEIFAENLQTALDKPGERHYTPHQTAAKRFRSGD
jgi:hypothetical protein